MANPSKQFEFIRLYPNLSSDPIAGRIGEFYWNTTINAPKVCVDDSPVTWVPLVGAQPQVEYRTISPSEEAAEEITLAETPGDPTKVVVIVLGGTAQELGIDYAVSGNILSWAGLGLAGFLASGDQILVIYWA